MRIVLQRAKNASVEVDGQSSNTIEHGFVVLLGIKTGDNKELCEKMLDKILKLRVFEDEDSKMNKSILDTGGGLLIISQFTLYANTKKGNRPSFLDSAKPDEAVPLYNYFIDKAKEKGINVETGVFQANMQVKFINDGPVTIILDSEE